MAFISHENHNIGQAIERIVYPIWRYNHLLGSIIGGVFSQNVLAIIPVRKGGLCLQIKQSP